MYKLLKVNNTEFITPDKGSFSISKTDKVNEYEMEDGTKTIEVVRSGVLSGTLSYKGLFASQVATYSALLSPVSTLTVFDPLTNNVRTFSAKISGKKSNKVVHNDNVSAWSFSFDFEEL